MIDIITTVSVNIHNVSNKEGLEILELAMKGVAKKNAEADEDKK